MKYRKMINGSLALSELGLGCASFWGNRFFSIKKAHRIVHKAIDEGVNYFDTGHSYSGGVAEKRLGTALKGRLEKCVISSKAGTRVGRYGRLFKDFSPSWIQQSCETSLRQLNCDHIPVFFLHGPNPEDFNDEVFGVLAKLRQEGKIGLVGVNSFDDHIIERAISSNQFQCVMLDFNIMKPERADTISSLKENGVDVMVAAALAGGLYDKRFTQFKGLKTVWYWLRALKNNRKQWSQAKQFGFLNDDETFTAVQSALAYVLENPGFSSALIGTTSEAHFEELIAATDMVIADDIKEQIASIQKAFIQ